MLALVEVAVIQAELLLERLVLHELLLDDLELLLVLDILVLRWLQLLYRRNVAVLQLDQLVEFLLVLVDARLLHRNAVALALRAPPLGIQYHLLVDRCYCIHLGVRMRGFLLWLLHGLLLLLLFLPLADLHQLR